MYEKLNSIMRSNCISTNKLALMSKIAPQDLYAALAGKKPMFPNWRKRISEALDMSIEELFSEEVETNE